MVGFHLTPKAQREMERKWEIEQRAIELLTIIAAEFRSDPSSVACFDLRIVEEAMAITDEYPKYKGLF
ncbi:hypothetical protein ACQZ5U_02365 [Agrobacterium sp. 22-3639C1]